MSPPARQGFAPKEKPEPKLVCVAGNQLGSEYVLTGEEVVVGRSPENVVSIPDNSVSRKHLLLRKTPAGWMASDMGSGNGTLLNGESLEEETLLKDGDQIAMGDTELQFASGGEPEMRLARAGGGAALEARRPARQSLRSRQREEEEANKKKKRQTLLWAVLGSMVVLAGVGIYFKVEEGKVTKALNEMERAELARKQILDERFQAARNLIRQGNWSDAQYALQELQGQAPDYNPREIEKLLKAAETEVPNQAALDAAQDALNVLELKAARTSLEQVANTEAQRERLGSLQKELQDAVRKKVAMAKNLASQTTDRESMVKLKTMTDDILAAVPNQRDAKILQEDALEAIRRIDTPAAKYVAPDTPWVTITEKYKAGDMEEATRLAEACAAKHARCKKMHTQLEDVASKNRRIENLSPKEFFDFYEVDRQLSEGAGSAYTQRIKLFAKPIVENSARNAKLTGRLGEATNLASNLLRMDPKNTTALGIMDEARAQAKETFLRGYTVRTTQPEQAERYYKEVLQMLPKDEEYAKKAQEQLRVLKGKISDEE